MLLVDGLLPSMVMANLNSLFYYRELMSVYQGMDESREKLREALCTLGNGYLATRGAQNELRAVHDPEYHHYPGKEQFLSNEHQH